MGHLKCVGDQREIKQLNLLFTGEWAIWRTFEWAEGGGFGRLLGGEGAGCRIICDGITNFMKKRLACRGAKKNCTEAILLRGTS